MRGKRENLRGNSKERGGSPTRTVTVCRENKLEIDEERTRQNEKGQNIRTYCQACEVK